jgi:Gpi18-like mannosyltransferase
VLAVKLVLAVVIYWSLGLASVNSFWLDAGSMAPLIQNHALLEGVSFGPRWAYIFLGWDSAWYLSIMEVGYGFSSQSFAFFPIFPMLGRVFWFLLKSPVAAIAVCSLVFGVLWVPLYQEFAEEYFDRKSAFISALLFATFPFTLIFSTVGYTEGIFLFTTLAAWLLFIRGRRLEAFLVAAIATLVRPPGFLIALPMLLIIIKEEGRWSLFKAFSSLALPFASMLIWLLYSWISFGDLLASFHTTEWSSMYSLMTYVDQVLPKWGFEALTFPISDLNIHWLMPTSIWGSLFITPILIWRLKITNTALTFYCLAYLTGILLFGTILSFPRFIAFLFPLWIPITGRIVASRYSRIIVPVLFIVFVAATYILWIGFLNGLFIA